MSNKNELGLPSSLAGAAKTETQVNEEINKGDGGAGDGGTGKTEAEIAAETEAARIAAESGKPEEITPDKIFGEEYKEKKWDDVKGEFVSVRQKAADLEKENTELKGRKPTFANTEVEEYNAWIANGGVADYNM